MKLENCVSCNKPIAIVHNPNERITKEMFEKLELSIQMHSKCLECEKNGR